MSGRIRSLKPELVEDEKVAELSDAAWRLFVGSWALCDDHGRCRAGAKWLAAQIWHDTSVTEKVRAALAELVRAKRVRVYVVADETYLEIPTWSRHQRIDNAGKPRVPPPSTGYQEVSERFAETRGDPPSVAANLGGSPLDLRPPIPTSDPDPDQRPAGCDGSRSSPSPVAAEGSDPWGLTPSEPPSPKPRSKPDLADSDLSAKETAIAAAIRADATLSPIVARPNQLAHDLAAAGPGLDVRLEVLRAAAWLRANPANAKKNGARFLLGWVTRQQERGPPSARGSPPSRPNFLQKPAPPGQECWTRNPDWNPDEDTP